METINIIWSDIIKSDAAAWIITIVTSLVLVYQTYKGKIYNKQLHELQRRVNATDSLYRWVSDLSKEESIIKRIAEQFSKEQIKIIINEGNFLYLKKDQYDILSVILKKKDNYNKMENKFQKSKNRNNKCFKCDNLNCPNSRNMKKLYKEDIVLLRWYLIQYLNKLEALLLQCKNGTVDIDVMYEQLKYQYNAKDGVMALKKVRYAMGPEAFPAIEWFCTKLEEKMRNDILEKGYIDINNNTLWKDIIDFLIKILNRLK